MLLRLIQRSNVEPKCGNNTFLVPPRSSGVSLFRLSPYRLHTVDGPCSATYCEPAKQYQVSRGRSRYLPRQGPTVSVFEGGLVIALVLLKDQIQEFEVDGRSPEVVTANQRACEVRIRD